MSILNFPTSPKLSQSIFFKISLNSTGPPCLFVSSIPFISSTLHTLHANMKAWSNKKLIFLTFIEALPTRLLFIFSLNIYERPIIGWIQSYFNVFPSLWMSDAFDEYTVCYSVLHTLDWSVFLYSKHRLSCSSKARWNCFNNHSLNYNYYLVIWILLNPVIFSMCCFWQRHNLDRAVSFYSQPWRSCSSKAKARTHFNFLLQLNYNFSLWTQTGKSVHFQFYKKKKKRKNVIFWQNVKSHCVSGEQPKPASQWPN